MPTRSSGLLHCSFCNKSQAEVKNLVAGPKDYICDGCATEFLSSPKKATFAEARIENCGFCGKSSGEVGAFFEREQARICNGCLDICREIVEYDLQPAGA